MSVRNNDLFERALEYQGDLIGFFTGSSMEETDYKLLRNDLLNEPSYGGLVPQFLKRCRDTKALWAFAKSVDPSWEPRRKFLREQFEPLLDHLEKGGALAAKSMPGQYDASAWTGVQGTAQQAKAIGTLIPVAQAAVATLIDSLEKPGHNGGPPLDEVEDALKHLRNLHTTLGHLLAAVEDEQLGTALGNGLVAEAARYGRRAAKALKSDPLPYALSATILAIFTACGFPGIAGYLGGVAMAIRKTE